jgi:hypothetical protein
MDLAAIPPYSLYRVDVVKPWGEAVVAYFKTFRLKVFEKI